MALLWKDDNPAVPYNRALAKARPQHLKRRFQRDPNLETKYRAVMDECVAKGYARKLVKEEAATVSNITWYLPHHPVINPNKSEKVRVVFDAAARFQGTSLNDKLLQGPSLTRDLTGVLLRFRQDQVAFSADIEGMFYQTKIRSLCGLTRRRFCSTSSIKQSGFTPLYPTAWRRFAKQLPQSNGAMFPVR